MIKRWVHAQIALDEQNNPVGIIYGGTSTFPNPQIRTPEKVTQSLEKMPRIDLIHHPPMTRVTNEIRNKAYGH